jgi:Na+-translocating ferredoxin:NAD+ oxidoreductase RnfD subunit
VAAAPRRFRIDDRYIAPLFITFILAVGQISYHILEDYRKTLLAIAASIATELLLGRLFYRKWPNWASAYVTGISVGILLRSPVFWTYALCSAISTSSKYAIQVKGKHVWNPSNLGIVCMMLLATQYASTLGVQFGNAILPMLVIWTLGSVIIYRLKRFHICGTYVICFFTFSFLRSLILHNSFLTEIAPITGPMYQLFIFFMITDPKTTVKGKWTQILVAALIAAVECVIRTWGSLAGPVSGSLGDIVASHAPYFALTIVGPIAMTLDIYRHAKKPAVRPVTSPA